MREVCRSLRSLVTVLTCVGLVFHPIPVRAGNFVQVEVDDAQDFRDSLKTFLTGQGFDSPEMKEFLRAPKAEWSMILDRFEKEFGFSPRAFKALSTGRIGVGVGKEGFLLGTVQDDVESVQSFVAELKKFILTMPQIEAEFAEEKDTARITIPLPQGAFLVAAEGKRLVVAGGPDQELCKAQVAEFLSGKAARIADRKDIPRELRGKGLIMMQDPSQSLEAVGGPMGGGMPSNVQEILGLSAPSFNRIYFEDNNLWVNGYIPSRKSLFTGLYVAGPVSQSSLAWLPAECDGAGGAHADLARLIPMILEMDPDGDMGIAAVLEQVNGIIGSDLQGELFAHLGDEVVFGQLPVGRGGGFPLLSALGLGSSYAVVSLKDPAAFKVGLDKLLGFLGAMAAQDTVGGGVKETMIEEVNVRYLRAVCGVLSPCFAVKGNHLVVTSNVPLMRFLLSDHGTWKSISEDKDFQTNLALLGGKLTSGFSYKRHHPRAKGAADATTALTTVAIVSILAAMLVPALNKARERARSIANLNTLRQFHIAIAMFQMDNEERYPKDLKELVDGQYIDEGFFEREPKVLHYCPPKEEGEVPADRPLAYSFTEGTGGRQGMNILFGDGHVAFHPAGSEECKTALALPAVESKPGEGPPEGAPAPAPEGPMNPDNLKRFVLTEARNLGRSVDFALFPSVAEFAREGSSNISLTQIRGEGLLTRAKVGHLGEGNGGALVGVAVIAILAAMLIPTLAKARAAAARPMVLQPPAALEQPVPPPR